MKMDPLFDQDQLDDAPSCAALFAENNARERRLWGDLLKHKRVLQRRGFGVWWHDEHSGRIHCGGRVVSVSEFVMAADREGRLLTKELGLPK